MLQRGRKNLVPIFLARMEIICAIFTPVRETMAESKKIPGQQPDHRRGQDNHAS
jgi:hypothetical protein